VTHTNWKRRGWKILPSLSLLLTSVWPATSHGYCLASYLSLWVLSLSCTYIPSVVSSTAYWKRTAVSNRPHIVSIPFFNWRQRHSQLPKHCLPFFTWTMENDKRGSIQLRGDSTCIPYSTCKSYVHISVHMYLNTAGHILKVFVQQNLLSVRADKP